MEEFLAASGANLKVVLLRSFGLLHLMDSWFMYLIIVHSALATRVLRTKFTGLC